jgi:hypothetical protein
MSTNKFESLLELLINEENEKAEALFHEIVVEKSRDIYENLADEEVTAEAKEESKDEEVKETEESKEDKVEETAEESKEDDKVEETSEESKDEQVDEVVELEDEATESETTEEESIEEVGGDATDELVKDISAEEEGEMDADNGEEMPADDAGEEDMEDRVVDLEDALDELKAEFEAMMGKKDDAEDMGDMDKEESLEPTPEVEMESKEAKETVKEYKNPVKADTADHSDKGAKSPVKDAGTKMPKGGDNIAKGSAEEKGRPAPTAQKMAGDFENTGGKAKSTSFKKQEKANTADGSDKSAKSPVAAK